MLALVAATLATYAYAGRCEYVGMDDFGYVTQNPHVLTGLTLDGVRYAFTTFDLANWHPLMWLSLMTTVSLFGPSAGPMHWTNVAIHLMSALVLFALVRQLTGTFWRAWLVAAIFAVHPTHVESVAWISERKDVQSVLFGLLSFYAWFDWVRTRRRVSWALAMVLAVLGLLSKPMLVTAPFVLLVLDFWPLCRFERLDRRVWPLVLEKLPLLALTIACSVVTVIAQRSHGAVQDLESFSVATRVANATVGYARYLGMIFWPVDLVAYYPHTRRPTVGLALGAVGLIVAVSVLSWRLRRTRPWWLVGWLWFLGTLVPVIGLVQVGGQSIADRYLYFPSIGITVIVAWELTALARRGVSATGAPVPVLTP